MDIILIYVNSKIVYFNTFTYLMSTSCPKQNANDGERYKTTDANSFYQSSLQLHFSVIHTLKKRNCKLKYFVIPSNDKNVKVCDQGTLQNHIYNYDKQLRLCLALNFCRMLQQLLSRPNLLSTCLELCIVTNVYGNENRYMKSWKVLKTSSLLWNNI